WRLSPAETSTSTNSPSWSRKPDNKIRFPVPVDADIPAHQTGLATKRSAHQPPCAILQSRGYELCGLYLPVRCSCQGWSSATRKLSLEPLGHLFGTPDPETQS